MALTDKNYFLDAAMNAYRRGEKDLESGDAVGATGAGLGSVVAGALSVPEAAIRGAADVGTEVVRGVGRFGRGVTGASPYINGVTTNTGVASAPSPSPALVPSVTNPDAMVGSLNAQQAQSAMTRVAPMSEGVPGKQEPGRVQSFFDASQKIGNVNAKKNYFTNVEGDTGQGLSGMKSGGVQMSNGVTFGLSPAERERDAKANAENNAYYAARALSEQNLTPSERDAEMQKLKISESILGRLSQSDAAQRSFANQKALQQNAVDVAANSPAGQIEALKLQAVRDLNSQDPVVRAQAAYKLSELSGKFSGDTTVEKLDPSGQNVIERKTQLGPQSAAANAVRSAQVKAALDSSKAGSVVNPSTIQSLLAQAKASQGGSFNASTARAGIRNKIIASLPGDIPAGQRPIIEEELDRLLGEIVK